MCPLSRLQSEKSPAPHPPTPPLRSPLAQFSSVTTAMSATSSLVFQLTDARSTFGGFNQITVCADDSGDPTSAAANCDWKSVVYVGAPLMQLAVYGPQEQTGPLFPHKFIQAGQALTFVWSSSLTATSVSLSMWMAAAGSTTPDVRASTLVASVATALPASASSFTWTVPSDLPYDPTMTVRPRAPALCVSPHPTRTRPPPSSNAQYFFTAQPLLAPPQAIAALAPLAGLAPPPAPAATTGGVYAQSAWGYVLAPPAASLSVRTPSAGTSFFLDEYTPVMWSGSGFAGVQAVTVELWSVTQTAQARAP